MNENVMIVWVVFIVAVAAIVLGVIAARALRSNPGPGRDLLAENERLGREVTTLKDRMSVLERITIEKENGLAREIENLRDRAPSERSTYQIG